MEGCNCLVKDQKLKCFLVGLFLAEYGWNLPLLWLQQLVCVAMTQYDLQKGIIVIYMLIHK